MLKSKTFWTGLITGVASVAKGCGVDIPEETFTGLLGMLAIFMRMGIKKGR